MEENNEKVVVDNELENNKLENNEKEPKKIEIVSGDGELNISPVYEHLEVEKPKPKENKEIVIPEVKDTIVRKEDTKK